MKVMYLLGGLGADSRVFNYLDLSGFETVFIDWIDVLPSETIESYAQRLSERIQHPNPLLVGVSFGGMIAVEISRKVKIEKVILISSATTIPWYLKLAGGLRLQFLVPPKVLIRFELLTFWLFGVSQPEEQQLLRRIIRDTNESFLKWAIKRILEWNPDISKHDVIKIHGSNDRLLPPSSHVDFLIKGGGHFMIVTRAKEISLILARFK
jgi:pimeloyl-ACP methyl ester carboxylesterase